MLSFTAFNLNKQNKVRFDPLIKDDIYAFLYFIPTKNIPEKFIVNVSHYGNDKILIEEQNFTLEFDSAKKTFQDHYIGIQQNGTKETVIFTTICFESNLPLQNVSIEVAVLKLKDGNSDRKGGLYLNPINPKIPLLVNR